MSSIQQTAESFFHACESGKGWAGCKPYCTEGATFSCQARSLADVTTLEGYTGWVEGLLTPVPDSSYELQAFAVDEERRQVLAFSIYRGTHTEEGGPVPPTGKRVEAEYVYVMRFDGDRIGHMTKIWDDGSSFEQLGWG